LRVRYYEVDDSVFLDDGYLIKGVSGRVLWLLLALHAEHGRSTFSNRELRLHPSLKLPGFKDNFDALCDARWNSAGRHSHMVEGDGRGHGRFWC
jgi:adenylate cyclase